MIIRKAAKAIVIRATFVRDRKIEQERKKIEYMLATYRTPTWEQRFGDIAVLEWKNLLFSDVKHRSVGNVIHESIDEPFFEKDTFIQLNKNEIIKHSMRSNKTIRNKNLPRGSAACRHIMRVTLPNGKDATPALLSEKRGVCHIKFPVKNVRYYHYGSISKREDAYLITKPIIVYECSSASFAWAWVARIYYGPTATDKYITILESDIEGYVSPERREKCCTLESTDVTSVRTIKRSGVSNE